MLPADQRLAEIPGVSLELARSIIAETGLDMTRFPTGHLASWAGLAPAARQSGPRNRKPRKGQGDAYLKGHCTQAAAGAAKTDTFLGERLRRLSRKLGGTGPDGVGRSILVIIWHLSTTPKPGSPTWDPTGTSAKPTATAKPATTSADCRPSATTSPSPPPPKNPNPRPPGPQPTTPRAP